MSANRDDRGLNANIEELREKMGNLKSDRRSNMGVIEASKIANRDEIKALRDQNKDYRSKLASMQCVAASSGDRNDKKFLEKEVERLRKAYDDVKIASLRTSKGLESLRDGMRGLDLDSQHPHMEDNEYTRNMRTLENKLDQAMIKYNEAQSIRKTYEQLVSRLNEERVGFDNQLKLIERTLSAKSRDHEELLLLAGDANHAKEVSLNELDRVRAGYEEERKKRERELRERHHVVQLRRHMLEHIKKRDITRETMVERTNVDAVDALVSAEQKMAANERIEVMHKIDIFESAFRKIKDATIVSDVNDLISKINSQANSTESLISLTSNNQDRLEKLNEEMRRLKGKVEELRFSGASGGAQRKLLDGQEEELSIATAKMERTRLKYDRLSRLMISMKAGIGHLQDKMESVRDEHNGKRIELVDETVVDALRETEGCIANVYRIIHTSNDAKRDRMARGLFDDTDMGETKIDMSDALDIQDRIRPYNWRVNLHSIDEEDVDLGSRGIDLEDDELSRDRVKRASNQIVLSVERRKRKPKKGESVTTAGDRSLK